MRYQNMNAQTFGSNFDYKVTIRFIGQLRLYYV